MLLCQLAQRWREGCLLANYGRYTTTDRKSTDRRDNWPPKTVNLLRETTTTSEPIYRILTRP